LANPVSNLVELNKRLEQIAFYQQHEQVLELLRRVLKQLPDLPRVQARLVYRKPSALLFQSLRNTFDYIFGPEALAFKQELLRVGLGEEDLNNLVSLYTELIAAIKDEQISDDMNFVAQGYDDAIDELSDIAYHSDDKLLEYQQQLSQLAGCQVKLKFVSNQ
jgi:DNA mismatch repair ATPase MutS